MIHQNQAFCVVVDDLVVTVASHPIAVDMRYVLTAWYLYSQSISQIIRTKSFIAKT